MLTAGILIIILVGCSQRPKEVLDEKQTIELLSDLQLASSYSDQHSYGTTTRDSARIKLAWGVMKKHKVSQAEFDSTLIWYGKNIDEYEKILVKVQTSLDKKRRGMLLEQEKESMKDDNELWITNPYTILSSMGKEILTFSIDNPEIDTGDNLVWTLRMQKSPQYYSLLGIEYENGRIRYVSNTGSSRNKLELSLQTDTASTPIRLFGQIGITDKSALPVYIDSISLKRFPFDSLEYRRKLNIQQILNKKFNVKPKVFSDTTSDTIR